MLGPEWHKSTFSHTNGCVEVTLGRAGVAVRDSKHPDGYVLAFSLAEWQAFLDGVRADQFDLPREAATR